MIDSTIHPRPPRRRDGPPGERWISGGGASGGGGGGDAGGTIGGTLGGNSFSMVRKLADADRRSKRHWPLAILNRADAARIQAGARNGNASEENRLRHSLLRPESLRHFSAGGHFRNDLKATWPACAVTVAGGTRSRPNAIRQAGRPLKPSGPEGPIPAQSRSMAGGRTGEGAREGAAGSAGVNCAAHFQTQRDRDRAGGLR